MNVRGRVIAARLRGGKLPTVAMRAGERERGALPNWRQECRQKEECCEGDGSSLPLRSACHNEVCTSGEMCVCARRAACEVHQGERGRRHLRAVHRHRQATRVGRIAIGAYVCAACGYGACVAGRRAPRGRLGRRGECHRLRPIWLKTHRRRRVLWGVVPRGGHDAFVTVV